MSSTIHCDDCGNFHATFTIKSGQLSGTWDECRCFDDHKADEGKWGELDVRHGLEDIRDHNIFDIPVLETILAVIAVYGSVLVVRGVRAHPLLRFNLVLAIGLCVGLAYGGWLWSEIIYDQQILSSIAVMESAAGKLIALPDTAPREPAPMERQSASSQGQEIP